jgi:hypothetical protein
VDGGLDIADDEVGRQLGVIRGVSSFGEVSADKESAHLGCARNSSIRVPCEEERR